MTTQSTRKKKDEHNPRKLDKSATLANIGRAAQITLTKREIAVRIKGRAGYIKPSCGRCGKRFATIYTKEQHERSGTCEPIIQDMYRLVRADFEGRGVSLNNTAVARLEELEFERQAQVAIPESIKNRVFKVRVVPCPSLVRVS